MLKTLDFAGEIEGKDGESAGFYWGYRRKRWSDGRMKGLDFDREIERKDGESAGFCWENKGKRW